MKNILAILLFISSLAHAQVIEGYGDSNTEYWIDLPQSQKFFYLVSTELSFTGYNYGHAATTLYSGVIPEVNAHKSEHPGAFATVMIGTNDAYQYIPTDQYRIDLRDTVKALINAGKTVLLISPNYEPTANIETADGQNNYRQRIEQIYQYTVEVATEVPQAKFIDLWARMKQMFDAGTPVSSLVGGYHLSAVGHRLLADMVKAKINQILPVKFTSVQAESLGDGRVKVSFSYADATGDEQFFIRVLIDGIYRDLFIKPEDKISEGKYSKIIQL